MADISVSDLSRPEGRPGSPGETQIERLLLAGLDHYFSGEYDRAISVWTRVLFLDRTHARARAYIDRARSALAERQREAEELMQRGVDAFGHGDTDAARRLLTASLEHGGPHETALAFLDRLDRLQPPSDAGASVPAARPVAPPLPPARRAAPVRLPPRRIRLLPVVVLTLVAAGVGYVALSWDRLVPVLLGPRSDVAAPRLPAAGAGPETLPVPAPGELALVRARAFRDSGHLREALQALNAIGPGSALRPEADRLTADIQRTLLESSGRPSAAAGVGK